MPYRKLPLFRRESRGAESLILRHRRVVRLVRHRRCRPAGHETGMLAVRRRRIERSFFLGSNPAVELRRHGANH